jgi:hypothetical protein
MRPAGGIEQAFTDARQVLGIGQTRNRPRRAVQRTAPSGLTCRSLITLISQPTPRPGHP